MFGFWLVATWAIFQHKSLFEINEWEGNPSVYSGIKPEAANV